jgi:hypothetical protein
MRDCKNVVTRNEQARTEADDGSPGSLQVRDEQLPGRFALRRMIVANPGPCDKRTRWKSWLNIEPMELGTTALGVPPDHVRKRPKRIAGTINHDQYLGMPRFPDTSVRWDDATGGVSLEGGPSRVMRSASAYF